MPVINIRGAEIGWEAEFLLVSVDEVIEAVEVFVEDVVTRLLFFRIRWHGWERGMGLGSNLVDIIAEGGVVSLIRRLLIPYLLE